MKWKRKGNEVKKKLQEKRAKRKRKLQKGKQERKRKSTKVDLPLNEEEKQSDDDAEGC